MKTKTYISPVTTELSIRCNHIICASGSPDRIHSGIGVGGGEIGGDPATAF